MTRIDYIDDPNAPKANSVVPSVVAIVQDDRGRLLLIHKVDNGKWALPGGGHDIGESITDTVVREVKEETGCDVEVQALTGTYTNPRHVMAYDDGEVRQQFSLAFRARLVDGEPRSSSESDRVEWVACEDLDDLDDAPVDASAHRGRSNSRAASSAVDRAQPSRVATKPGAKTSTE